MSSAANHRKRSHRSHKKRLQAMAMNNRSAVISQAVKTVKKQQTKQGIFASLLSKLTRRKGVM